MTPAARLPLCLWPLLALLCAGCGSVVDVDQSRLCERVLPALLPDGTRIERVESRPAEAGSSGVTLAYFARTPEDTAARPDRITCRFAAPTGPGRLDLVGVTTIEGDLGEARLFILKRWWLEAGGVAGFPAHSALFRLPTPWAYGLQQALNALPNMAAYAALAAAFTLIHGLTGRIILAMGEIAVAGGGAMLAVAALAPATGAFTLAHLLFGLVAGTATGGLWMLTFGRLVLRRMAERRDASQAVIIASIGLALVLREAMTLAQSGAGLWLPRLVHTPVPLAGSAAFTATVTPALIGGALASGCGVAGVLALLHFSRFGRDWRAFRDDPLMASLSAVAPSRLLGATFLLAGALSGLAGASLVLVFGNLDAALGLPLTLKTLAGAILGGVGSVGGAAAGGLLVGALEGGWSSLWDIAWRDVALYGLLILGLMARPEGLFGSGTRNL